MPAPSFVVGDVVVGSAAAALPALVVLVAVFVLLVCNTCCNARSLLMVLCLNPPPLTGGGNGPLRLIPPLVWQQRLSPHQGSSGCRPGSGVEHPGAPALCSEANQRDWGRRGTYVGRGSVPPLPFSFELIEWTSGPVAVLPFVGNSAVPRARSACCNHAERPEIVSLLPEDLQNKLAWECVAYVKIRLAPRRPTQ